MPFFRLALGLVFLATSALADAPMLPANPQWLMIDRNREVFVSKSDQVTGGCWRNTQRSIDEVSLELIRSNFEIVETDDFGTIAEVTAIGYAINEYNCAVIVQINVWTPVLQDVTVDGKEFTSIYRHKIWSTSSILTGPKKDMSHRVAQTHRNMVQSFLIDLASESKNVLAQAARN